MPYIQKVTVQTIKVLIVGSIQSAFCTRPGKMEAIGWGGRAAGCISFLYCPAEEIPSSMGFGSETKWLRTTNVPGAFMHSCYDFDSDIYGGSH